MMTLFKCYPPVNTYLYILYKFMLMGVKPIYHKSQVCSVNSLRLNMYGEQCYIKYVWLQFYFKYVR